MAESARPLDNGQPNLDTTPTPAPVSEVRQSVRPPEVMDISNDTQDLLGAALDELGVKPSNNAVVVSLDAARAAMLAKELAAKNKLKPANEVKTSLEGSSFDQNPAPEVPSNISAAE
jgi:hypothetical protein